LQTGGGEPFEQKACEKNRYNSVCEQCFSEVDIMPENINESDKDNRLGKEYSS
jgi:hypothetical protein